MVSPTDEWNIVIAEYALREEFFARRRAEICGCKACWESWDDALERQDWVLMMGIWEMKGLHGLEESEEN